jgi:hypothetical protein
MKSVNFVLTLYFISNALNVSSQISDTILNMVISKPYFYNVVKSKEGEIFTGTSEGVYQWDGTHSKKTHTLKGYITIDKEGKPVINPEGIKNYRERVYSHLLPYQFKTQDEYHASTDKQLYIVSGGRMYIFDIVPYQISYPGHSIRTISQEVTGTYSGIYYHGIRMDSSAPSYCDGYARKIGTYNFLCFGGLYIISPDPTKNCGASGTYLNNPRFSEIINDIMQSKFDKQYYVSGDESLFRLSDDLQRIDNIYSGGKSSTGVTLVAEIYNEIYFTDEKLYLRYSPVKQTIDTVARLPEAIVCGFATKRHSYLLSKTGLYMPSTGNNYEKVVDLEKAHSMVPISDSEIVISTDNGLFHVNIVSKTLQALILGVEFNRRALYIENKILQAGSINGLYTIRVQDINALINSNKVQLSDEKLPPWVKVSLIAVILFIILMSILLSKVIKKLRKVSEDYAELSADLLTRKKIEDYIRSNLAIASLKTIAEYFNTNNSRVYSLLEPDKPGSIIQQLRFEKIQEMAKADATLGEMAEITGLSESYIKKVKEKFK